MSDLALAALVLAITGAYAVRWSRRLAPPWSELPAKTLAATGLAVAVLASEVGGGGDDPLATFALAVAAAYVLAPIALPSLGRAGAYRVAHVATRVAYWTPPARHGIDRVVAQAALRRGDLDAAGRLLPDDADLLRVQWWAASERWDDVLADAPDRPAGATGPADADNLALADDARVRALLARGRLDEADALVTRLARDADADDAGPLTERVAVMAGARLAAARGRVAETQRRLQPPPSGVPAHELFAVLATAADRAEHAAAGDLWRRAYEAAPEGWRPRYAARLRAAGRDVPHVRTRRPVATLALVATILAAFGVQEALDRTLDPVLTAVGALRPSSAAAAFLVGIPGVPDGEALWRWVSYALVHGGVLHVGFNAWVLFDLGRLYERRRRAGDLLGAFVLGTALGAWATGVLQAGDTVVLVGASGGVLGVAGALLADVLRGRSDADRALTRTLLQWMALITVFSFAVPGVSLWGHVGGVLGGVLYGFARQGLPPTTRISQGAGVAAIAALAVAAGAAGRIVASLL